VRYFGFTIFPVERSQTENAIERQVVRTADAIFAMIRLSAAARMTAVRDEILAFECLQFAGRSGVWY
jgi:hypothetical protein